MAQRRSRMPQESEGAGGLTSARQQPMDRQSQARRQRRLLSQLQQRRPSVLAEPPVPSFLAEAAATAQNMGLDVTPPNLAARSNSAARLVAPQQMGVVEGEMPLLQMCPPGSVLVQARYASICGSDLPYFRSTDTMGQGQLKPNTYWDRDGFCGHEVVGTVIASKSAQFAVGDYALALPASYFKSHAGGKQDWYSEDIHGVLLEPFPTTQTRGAFCEVYVSHELYCWKISSLTKAMVTAQGNDLETLLRALHAMGN